MMASGTGSNYLSASDVIGLLDSSTGMDSPDLEPVLEGSDDDLDLQLSNDEERYNNIICIELHDCNKIHKAI